jgi:ATP-dependent DNA ligase
LSAAIRVDGDSEVLLGGINLFSRLHGSFNHQYPYLVEALSDLPEGTVVDSEVVALDESGRPNFNLLQNSRSEASRIHYFIFDLLIYNDRDLTRLPLSERHRFVN